MSGYKDEANDTYQDIEDEVLNDDNDMDH